MKTEDTTTIFDLEIDLQAELSINRQGLIDSEDSVQLFEEIVDGLVPVYNGRLLEVAYSDLSLGYLEGDEEDCGSDIYAMLMRSIYKRLEEKGMEWLNKEGILL